MEKIERWTKRTFSHRIERQFDAIVPVIADEGMGKSTLMLELAWLWQDVRGLDPDAESVLNRVVWGNRDELKHAMASYPERAAIPVMDSARALYKRDAMQSEQKDAEKDLLDVRTREFFILLGYQDYDDIPSSIAKRRASAALRIPRRGVVWGYSRASLDEMWDTGDWPDPDMRDTFPDLEGTRVWEEFQCRDKKKKQERIQPDDEDEADVEVSPQSVAQEIKTEGVRRVVSIHGGNKQPFIDADLIELDYGLSARDSTKVKKLLDRDPEIDLEQFKEEA